MNRLAASAVLLTGVVPLTTALAALVGVGMHREGPAWAVGVAAVCLTFLPWMGLASMFGRGLGAYGGAAWAWSAAALFTLPMYFPGERQEAIATGYAALAAPFGPEVLEDAVALGDRVGGLLGDDGVRGTTPPEVVEAEPVEAAEAIALLPEPRALDEDEVVLPYEGSGRSLRVQAAFDGPAGTDELWMLFDTGATFTTLSEAQLHHLGITVPDDAPSVRMQTAGGEREARLVLVDSVWIGGFEVQGVTVAVCEPCAGEETSGLLGLNVTGNFQVTMDPTRHELVLSPHGGSDRKLDIANWLDITARATSWSDGRFQVEIETENLSPRDVSSAQVMIECPDERFPIELGRLDAYDVGTTRRALPRGTECGEYRVVLDEASW